MRPIADLATTAVGTPGGFIWPPANSPTRISDEPRSGARGCREIPPPLFGTVVERLADAGLTASARVVVEKPFGHDLESARSLAHELHEHIDEAQLFRIDHYLRKMGLEEILYLRFFNAILEPIWNRSYLQWG